MCDPITLAGVALTGLSTGLNYMGASRAANARDDALAAERIRQQGFDREADAINAQSQGRYENFEGKQTDKSAELADYFTGQEVAAPTAEAALPTSASNITVQEQNKQSNKARAATDRSGAALGQLRSFGDLLGEYSRAQARDAGQIGQIAGFKRGSQSVLPFELDAASQAGSTLGLFGDIAGGLGSIGIGAGLSGKPVLGFGGVTPTVNAAARTATTAAPVASGISSMYGGNR